MTKCQVLTITRSALKRAIDAIRLNKIEFKKPRKTACHQAETTSPIPIVTSTMDHTGATKIPGPSVRKSIGNSQTALTSAEIITRNLNEELKMDLPTQPQFEYDETVALVLVVVLLPKITSLNKESHVQKSLEDTLAGPNHLDKKKKEGNKSTLRRHQQPLRNFKITHGPPKTNTRGTIRDLWETRRQ